MTRLLTAEEVAAKSARNRAARIQVYAPVGAKPAAVDAATVLASRLARPSKARFGDTRVAKSAVAHATRKPVKLAGPKRGSKGEELLAFQLHAAKIIGWEREFRFHPVRKWRLDFSFPTEKLGIEVDGGIWSAGRHTRGAGFEGDCRKYNALALAGWRLLRYTPAMIKSGRALCDIQLALMGDA